MGEIIVEKNRKMKIMKIHNLIQLMVDLRVVWDKHSLQGLVIEQDFDHLDRKQTQKSCKKEWWSQF